MVVASVVGARAPSALKTEDEALLDVPGGSILRQVGWLATPVLVEQALLYLVGFSDTVENVILIDNGSSAAKTNIPGMGPGDFGYKTSIRGIEVEGFMPSAPLDPELAGTVS